MLKKRFKNVWVKNIKWDYIYPQVMNSWLSVVLQHPNTIYDQPCTAHHHSQGKQNIKELGHEQKAVWFHTNSSQLHLCSLIRARFYNCAGAPARILSDLHLQLVKWTFNNSRHHASQHTPTGRKTRPDVRVSASACNLNHNPRACWLNFIWLHI